MSIYRLERGMTTDSNDGWLLLEPESADREHWQQISIYRRSDVDRHPLRFRLAWLLARLAFWVWTA